MCVKLVKKVGSVLWHRENVEAEQRSFIISPEELATTFSMIKLGIIHYRNHAEQKTQNTIQIRFEYIFHKPLEIQKGLRQSLWNFGPLLKMDIFQYQST